MYSLILNGTLIPGYPIATRIVEKRESLCCRLIVPTSLSIQCIGLSDVNVSVCLMYVYADDYGPSQLWDILYCITDGKNNTSEKWGR